MIIRNAIEQELQEIRELRINAYQEHKKAISDEHWNALKKQITSDADQQPGVELMVAELNGKLVGSVALFPPIKNAYEGLIEELPYSEIRMLAVLPEARGKGVASALVQECISRAKEKEFSIIGLHTADFMKSALHLYERIGFERFPENDFIPADDGVIVKAFRLSI